MSDFWARRDAALKIMTRTPVSERNYCPPTFKYLWRLGIKIRPPHFMPFTHVFAFMGAPFAICAASMCQMMHQQIKDLASVTMAAGLFGLLFFGVPIAFYYYFGRKAYNIPAWDDIVIKCAGR